MITHRAQHPRLDPGRSTTRSPRTRVPIRFRDSILDATSAASSTPSAGPSQLRAHAVADLPPQHGVRRRSGARGRARGELASSSDGCAVARRQPAACASARRARVRGRRGGTTASRTWSTRLSATRLPSARLQLCSTARSSASDSRVAPAASPARATARPTYGQLARLRAGDPRGADDESEMGAFHDLYQPQRAGEPARRAWTSTPRPAWTPGSSSPPRSRHERRLLPRHVRTDSATSSASCCSRAASTSTPTPTSRRRSSSTTCTPSRAT